MATWIESQLLAGGRVIHAHHVGMEEDPVTVDRLLRARVGLVADDGIVDRRHVDSDLVGAARGQRNFEQGHIRSCEFLDDFVVGHRRFPARDDRSPRRPIRVSSDRRVTAPVGVANLPWTRVV